MLLRRHSVPTRALGASKDDPSWSRSREGTQLRVLLIANYPHDRQPSMQRYARLLEKGLGAGYDVRIAKPRALLGSLRPPLAAVRKWLGFVDKFILFMPELLIKARGADVVHICDQGNALYVWLLRWKPHLVTCHDVTAIRSALGSHPENPLGWTGRLFQHLTHEGLTRAMRVVCVSAATAERLKSLGRVRPEHIDVIENGLNYTYAPMPARDVWRRVAELGIPEGSAFLLHVGSNEWYKNRVGMVDIFAEIRRRAGDFKLRLVLAGQPLSAEVQKAVDRHDLANVVHELVDVSDENLRALYCAAQALIFPSIEEGFGWPIIEAQACGCPVFASACEPLQSVGGNAARYFNPKQPSEAATIILSGLAARDSMASAGLQNATRFSSKLMIERYAGLYRRVLLAHDVAA
jgi:glycosyltransferase involved in cell wall biosynthesis